MRKLLVLCFSVFSMVSMAQSSYELGMQKALQQWQEGNPKEAIAVLDRVAASNKTNWIPSYYKVFISLTQGLNNPQGADVLEMVEQNREVIAQWLEVGGEEWYVLKGLNETLDLITDPMVKGMTQSPIIIQAYEEAIKRNADNPRAVYSLASFYLNSAKFMQVDIPYYCQLLKKSIVLFDEQKNDVPFYPSWGKEWAIKAQEACNGK